MDPLDRADPDPRRLLADYRAGERMPPALREAAWLRLQAAVRGDQPDTAVTQDLADAPAPARTAPRRQRLVVLVLALAALALLVAGLGQFLRPGGRAEPGNQAAHDLRPVDPTPTAPAGGPLRSTTSRAADEPRTADPPSSAEPATPEPARPSTRRRATPLDRDPALGLDAELSLLRRARAALPGAPQQALQLLAEHRRRFPAGHLAEERTLLRVQALCAAGQRDRARAAARSFARAYPDSPHTPTIAATCE